MADTPDSSARPSGFRAAMKNAVRGADAVAHLQAAAAQADSGTGGAPMQVPGQEPSAKLVLELRNFRFLNQENGFLVAAGRATNLSDRQPVGLPAVYRDRYDPSKVTIRGLSPALATPSAVGTTIEVAGEWVMDPKFGLQFQFAWAREIMPSSEDALRAYLSAGRLKGIGPALANQIVDRFGMDTLSLLDETPEKLTQINGISEAKAKAIGAEWADKRALYRLTAFFGLYGVGETWIPRLVEALGDKDLESRVRANPYLLTQVDGIGFATADKMAMALGFEPLAPKRVEAFLVHLLDEYTSRKGHTACPTDMWFREASAALGLSQDTIAPYAQELINARRVVLRTLPVDDALLSADDRPSVGTRMAPCVSLSTAVAHERSIATDLRRLSDSAKSLSERALMVLNKGLAERATTLDASQIEGVLGVLNNPVSVLTGGPGTGKTTTLKSVLDIAEAMGWTAVLCAPTGRAAKRMEEAVGRPSMTIHRTLRYNPKEGFTCNRSNPLQGDVFVVDEASMLDNDLASKFLAALPDNARVIFVGDIDQLPSVGAGAFLKDLMGSGAAAVHRLTRIHRQAAGSLIAHAAAQVVSGHAPHVGGDPWTDDFSWLAPPTTTTNTPAEVNEFIRTALVALVEGLVKKGVPKDDIQILSPQREGPTGVVSLNEQVRWILNANGTPPPRYDEEEVSPFVVGDRVLVNKNNYDKNIFNGDMGVVQTIDPESGEMLIKMENADMVTLERAEQKILSLGFATTVHKSQGGERPVVLLAMSPSHTISLSKNLIYTGSTRAKSKLVWFALPRTVIGALKRQERMYRATGLQFEIERVRARPAASDPRPRGPARP